MEVERATKHLIGSIRDTHIYKNFEMQQRKVKNMPELKREIDEFRRRNYELHNFENEDTLFEKMDAFEEEYAAFRENPIVEDFLAAELSLCRMMQDVYGQLTDAVNLEC